MEAVDRGALYRLFAEPWGNLESRDNIRAAFRHYRQLHGLAPAEADDAPGMDEGD
ncbi:MAG TPA: hypothetical protein VEC06_15090 [Paucimonas sp.]|nr:hypothetical protein [Paucimonas sp.]